MIQAAELDAAAIPAMFVLQELMIERCCALPHKRNPQKRDVSWFQTVDAWHILNRHVATHSHGPRVPFHLMSPLQGQRWNFLEHGGTGLELGPMTPMTPMNLRNQEWRSMVHLSLSCVFSDVCLVFSHQSRSAVRFTCWLCGRSVRVCVWSKWSLNVPQLCSTLPVRCRQGWPSLAATDGWQFSRNRNWYEKLSGGQYPWWNMMLHYSSTYYFPALQKAFLTLKVSLFFQNFCPGDARHQWRITGIHRPAGGFLGMEFFREFHGKSCENTPGLQPTPVEYRTCGAFRTSLPGENHRKTMGKPMGKPWRSETSIHKWCKESWEMWWEVW